MARVPTYGNFRVLPGGVSAGRVRADDRGLASVQGRDLQQVGQSVQRVGGALNQYVEREQDRINQARVREATLTLRDELAEAELEYQKYKGAELVAGDKPIMRDIEARIEQSRSQIMQGLSSPAAQEAFELTSMEMTGTWRNRAAAYEAEQADFYVSQQQDGVIAAQIETAVTDPTKRATSLQSAAEVLREKFEDQGFDGDRLNQKTQEAMGVLLSGQIDVLLDAKRIDDAEAVLDAARDMMAPSAVQAISAKVEAANFNRDVNETAQRIFDEHGGAYGEGLLAAESIKDPEKQEAVKKRLNALRIREDAVRTQLENEAADRAWAILAEGGTPDDIDPRDWNALGGRAKLAIEGFQQQRVNAEQSRLDAISSNAYDMIEAVHEIDPALYMQGPEAWPEQLQDLYGQLQPGDAQKLSQNLLSRSREEEAAPEVRTNFNAVKADMGLVALELFPDEAKAVRKEIGRKPDHKKRLLLEGIVLRRTRQWTAENGGQPMTEADRRQIIRMSFNEFDEKKFEVLNNPFRVPLGIARQMDGQVRSALRNQLGREPTDAEVEANIQRMMEQE